MRLLLCFLLISVVSTAFAFRLDTNKLFEEFKGKTPSKVSLAIRLAMFFWFCYVKETQGKPTKMLQVIRVCFKDNSTPDVTTECAYCNPRTLQRIMNNCTNTEDGIPANLWNNDEKRCILRTCRQAYPSQKILPTLTPLKTLKL